MSQKRMTHKRALEILIEEAAKGASGAGVGLREPVTRERKLLVARAITKAYPKAYGHEVSHGDFFRWNLPDPREKNDD